MTDSNLFTRRRFLTTTVALATTLELQRAARALGLSGDAEVCKLAPEQEVGPYYVADEMLRSDLVEGKAGVPLLLRIVVLDGRTCRPLAGAAVDVWHCDALGLYSGFTKQNPMGPGGPGGPPPGFDPQHPDPQHPDPQHPGNRPGPPEGMGMPPASHPTDKLTFLRGIQMTGADGSVRFGTIFPGYYMGRTNHIHFKVRVDGRAAGRSYAAGHTSHTGQVFFPEEMSVRLMGQAPYALHRIHRTTQAEDGVFGGQGGALSIATLRPLKVGGVEHGYVAELVAAVDPTATPAAARREGGLGQPGRPSGPGGPPPS